MMRLLTLYLRSRQVPRAAPAAVVATAALALVGNEPDHPLQTVTFAVLALALGFGVLGLGLGGADPELDRTGALPWWRWRTTHTAAIAVVVLAAGLAATSAPTGLLVRDAAGLAGLTALAATAFGNQLAWTLPIAWGGVAAVVPPVADPVVLVVLTWPMQPPDSGVAAVTAVVLACAGSSAYAVRGTRS